MATTRSIMKSLCLVLCLSSCVVRGSASSRQIEEDPISYEPTFAERYAFPAEKILEYSRELQKLHQQQLPEEPVQQFKEPTFAEKNGFAKEKILEYASEIQKLHGIQAAAVEPPLDPAFSRSVCPTGLVHVTAGMRLYSNSRNYNQNGRKCDWSFNAACDVKFYVTYSWTGQSGLKEFDDQEYGVFKNSATVNFNPQYLYQTQACARPGSTFKIGVRAVDTDNKGKEEPIGEWNFQYYVTPGEEDEDIKISQKSGAYVKVFFDS
ncbi:hypothetical protein RvY_04732 [Ramazzottius varieornatus]|uniref:Uncharacterized protein n=1 Tax=Ramazzottius varieornatus TaxID=947166 RepID=A0A1D1V1T3_RAMVA|nr:hypothetical protein RvY_04732 [Ramazzottius varieornatus]